VRQVRSGSGSGAGAGCAVSLYHAAMASGAAAAQTENLGETLIPVINRLQDIFSQARPFPGLLDRSAQCTVACGARSCHLPKQALAGSASCAAARWQSLWHSRAVCLQCDGSACSSIC